MQFFLRHKQGRILFSFLIVCTLLAHSKSNAWAQLSSWYEPGVAISSGLSFSGKMAEESAVWFRNGFRITKGESSPLFICANLGYNHRSYSLDYYSPFLESSSSGISYRNAFALQLGGEMQLRNIRKLRKVMLPFAGVYFQRQFYKVPDQEKVAREYFKLDGYKIAIRQIVLEVGTEFVSEKWPKFFFSLQYEPRFLTTQLGSAGYVSITDEQNNEIEKVDVYYRHKELPCVRLCLGIKF